MHSCYKCRPLRNFSAKGGSARQWVDGGSVYDRKLKRTATQDLRILKDQLVQIRMNVRPANGGTSIRIGARGNQAKTRFRLITAKTNEGEVLLFLISRPRIRANRFDLFPQEIRMNAYAYVNYTSCVGRWKLCLNG